MQLTRDRQLWDALTTGGNITLLLPEMSAWHAQEDLDSLVADTPALAAVRTVALVVLTAIFVSEALGDLC